ncbi:uncharacterized protein LOC135372494 [Ornithodoros turicata]|uniref:uncharacterized protein LOC135372427 n=1 Tax=Ornithodoros turicata TaxID=34597 RepID=UPI0031397913
MGNGSGSLRMDGGMKEHLVSSEAVGEQPEVSCRSVGTNTPCGGQVDGVIDINNAGKKRHDPAPGAVKVLPTTHASLQQREIMTPVAVPSVRIVSPECSEPRNDGGDDKRILNDSPVRSPPRSPPLRSTEVLSGNHRHANTASPLGGSRCSLFARSLLLSLLALMGVSSVLGVVSWRLFQEAQSIDYARNASSLLRLFLNGSFFPITNDSEAYVDINNDTLSPVGL